MGSTVLLQGQFCKEVPKMTSFLLQKKSKAGYFEKISTEPSGTQSNRKHAIQNLERFVALQYSKTVEDIASELTSLKKQDEDLYVQALYDMLQKWINWNEKERRGNYTIRVMFSNIRKYLYYLGVKTDPQDIKENLRFGKKTREERHPLSENEYRTIVDGFAKYPHRQALFLALGSSGMRIGEAMNLKKKDLDMSKERIKVNIGTETKTRSGRSTYISKEAEEKLRPLLAKMNPDDYVFRKDGSKCNSIKECEALQILLKRLGMDNKYASNRVNKITTHSFRSYFFTKAVRKHGENYAHKMIGHGGYLMQYDRMTEEEKLKKYIELEPDLMIYDQTRNELEIIRLKKENEIIGVLQDQIKRLKEEKITLEKLTKQGETQ